MGTLASPCMDWAFNIGNCCHLAGRSILEIAVTWLGVLSFSVIFTWFYNNTQSLPVVMLLHAALNSFDDVYESIFPSLVNIDWELPYVAGILLIGIALSFIVNRPIKQATL